MKNSNTLVQAFGPLSGKLIVLMMFVGVPLGVWWVASPMISSMPIREDYRSLLSMSVFASMAFGFTCSFLVWRDLHDEP